MKQSVKKKECKIHNFQIIKKSGRKTGTPTWKCKWCPKKVKAS